MRSRTKRLRAICALGGATMLAALAAPASAQSEGVDAIVEPINQKYSVDIKKLFATSCSLCHAQYGMKQGDRGGGPKLAGTAKTRDQVVDRIQNGKSGLMPAFKSSLKDEQIQALADYIKALPAK